ncbi:hypothetical protein DOMOVOI_02480 [Brevundimonas phage vB_BpoS-Domovoi]|uniref:Uncharacterized protein n=1 Tax=Brevundimonas phage vB_BpoS-Domovoi TaxID=2948598 RepID=A0A9E7MRY3_9CAUD|nr:hypothetical protein DOMOVOI_02480 [Brevundimonas phage vB_BpoS-Domovoi]
MHSLYDLAANMLTAAGWKPPRFAPDGAGLSLHAAVYRAALRHYPMQTDEQSIAALYQEAVWFLGHILEVWSLTDWLNDEARTQDEVIALLRRAEGAAR